MREHSPIPVVGVMCACLLLLVPAETFATVDGCTGVDPLIQRVEWLRDRLSAAHPFHRTLPEHSSAGSPVTLRLTSAPTEAQIRDLKRSGFTVSRTQGVVDRVGPVLAGWVQPTLLCALGQRSDVVRVETTWMPWKHPTLNVAGPQVEAPGIAAASYAATSAEAGAGQVIANLDTGVDIHHPGLFKADGGAFVWIDTNGDGALTPGVDGVDRDGDGSVGSDETLRFIDADLYHSNSIDPFGAFNPAAIQPLDGAFDARYDWLYVDVNGNGQRDHGAQAGYGENDPSFGEPFFVVDDWNHSGAAELDERLLMLNTSKIKGIWAGGQAFERGKDLLDSGPIMTDDNIFHGTGSTGILVGGHPGAGRYTGLAPAADVLMITTGSGVQMSTLVWAKNHGMSVMMFEFGYWYMQFKDGSSNMETVIDSLSAEGISTVTPSGNLGGRSKNVIVDVPKGYEDVGFNVPGFYEDTGDPQNIKTVILTLLWRKPASGFQMDVQAPSGEIASFPGAASAVHTSPKGWTITADTQTSPRDTFRTDLIITTVDEEDALPYGDWILRMGNPKTTPVRVWTTVADDISGWLGGVKFQDFITDESTISFPATADTAITVGAYGGRFAASADTGPGKLRTFSGRGPRIDGVMALDVLAPDDPIVIGSGRTLGKNLTPGGYQVFGGTSGAVPHGAAAVALLQQLLPEKKPTEIRALLQESALAEPEMLPAPSGPYGWGKLRLAQAGLGASAPPLTPPTVAVAVSDAVGLSRTINLSESVDATGGSAGLQYRFDVEYDGFWDTDLQVDPTHTVTYPVEGDVVAKVEVVDAAGARTVALLPLSIVDVPAPPTPEPNPDPAPEPDPAPDPDPEPIPDSGPDTQAEPAPASGGSGGCVVGTPSNAFPFWTLWAFVLLVGLRRWTRDWRSG